MWAAHWLFRGRVTGRGLLTFPLPDFRRTLYPPPSSTLPRKKKWYPAFGLSHI